MSIEELYEKRINKVIDEFRSMYDDLVSANGKATKKDFYEGFSLFMGYNEARIHYSLNKQLGSACTAYKKRDFKLKYNSLGDIIHDTRKK